MSVTQAAMTTKVRRRLADASTRRDGTSVTNPFHSDATVQAAINDAVRERQSDIIAQDKTFYLTTAAFVGITDAVAATSNQQYNLPSDFKDWVKLGRSDLPSYPTVKLVPHEFQDAYRYRAWDFFAGFYATYPENLSPSDETAAILTGVATGARTNRFRILPAPASTSYTYTLWYIRTPTEPSQTTYIVDIPDEWQEVVALDTALYLAAISNDESAGRLEHMRDLALAARLRDNGERNAGRVAFGNVRL